MGGLALLIGCSSSRAPGGDEPASPLAAADTACRAIDACGLRSRSSTQSACTDRLTADFSSRSADCYRCLAQLSCDKWIVLSDPSLDTIVRPCHACRACSCEDNFPQLVSSMPIPMLMPPPNFTPPSSGQRCTPGSQSVPFAAGDPCRNPGQCGAGFAAVTTCLGNGTFAQPCSCLALGAAGTGAPIGGMGGAGVPTAGTGGSASAVFCGTSTCSSWVASALPGLGAACCAESVQQHLRLKPKRRLRPDAAGPSRLPRSGAAVCRRQHLLRIGWLLRTRRWRQLRAREYGCGRAHAVRPRRRRWHALARPRSH